MGMPTYGNRGINRMTDQELMAWAKRTARRKPAPRRAATICRRTRRQRRLQSPLVGMGMPTYGNRCINRMTDQELMAWAVRTTKPEKDQSP